MVIEGTIEKKILKSSRTPVAENFMGQENTINSLYQMKGKVYSPIHYLKASIIIICWKNLA